MKNIFIVASTRTPLASFQGAFASLSATQLGAVAIESSMAKANIEANKIEEVYFGNVVSAGLGQAPARQAALEAGLLTSTPCTSVSKVCGSGMKAVMLAANAIQCGHIDIAVAGGMESMSNAPYLLEKARGGHRLGHTSARDALFVDGLEDARTGQLMGLYGQKTADDYEFDREALDDYALESLARAQQATNKGYLDMEITPVSLSKRKETIEVKVDEQVLTAKPEKIRSLKPAFKEGGTVTAANSSSMSDGAASMLILSQQGLQQTGLKAEAKICGYVSHAQKPEEFTIAPVGAINKLLQHIGWSANDVDLFEINEAFAVVALHAIKELHLDHAKVNIHGGACAIGHPLGATGARIIVTLIHALQRLNKSKGIASLCIGGGEATAIAIELV